MAATYEGAGNRWQSRRTRTQNDFLPMNAIQNLALSTVVFITAMQTPGLAQVRITPKEAKGGPKQSERWVDVPETFTELRHIPEWPAPTDLKQWQTADRDITRQTLMQ